jgi:hypothetical protein
MTEKVLSKIRETGTDLLNAPFVRGRVFGLTAVALVLLATVSGCVWFRWRHQLELSKIADDPYSVSVGLALLVLLYLLLVTARAAHEPQYSMFLLGRTQEIVFLRQWSILLAPLVVLASLGVGYWKERWEVPLSVVGWLAAVYAVYDVVRQITGAWLRPLEPEAFSLMEAGNPPAGVAWLPADNRINVPSGYRALPAWRGRKLCVPQDSDWKMIDVFLSSDKLNAALQDDSSNLCRTLLGRQPEPFELPESLKKYREIAFIHTRSKGGLLHNESKIRLASDPAMLLDMLDGNGRVLIQKTSYYMSICSNELTRFIAIPKGEKIASGEDLFNRLRSRETGVIFSLEDSELSNHMGGGTLALTPDGRLHLSKQGRLAIVSSGMLASAGSGSFDWNDQAGRTKNFAGLIKTGLERELMEECSVLKKDIRRTIILGMCRDLSRGGKPDFLGITFLKRNGVRFEPKISRTEIGFVDHHDAIELAATTAAGLKAQLEDWLVVNQTKCGPQLVINLRLLMTSGAATYRAMLEHMGKQGTV